MRGPKISMTALAALVLLLSANSAALADTEISARDRTAASQAYDRGTSEWLSNRFDRAARWFEMAHRLVPIPAALIQATRARMRAGEPLRAASLALQLAALYTDNPQALSTAREALQNANQFVRVDVDCEACSLSMGDQIIDHPSFFLEPGVAQAITAEFETGTRTETVQGDAGAEIELSFEAPLASTTAIASDTSAPAQANSNAAIPLPVTLTAYALTLASAGVLIWSGIDTLDAVPAYENMPTQAGLEDGQAREERTNWLIGTTVALSTISLALTFFTNWDESRSTEDAAGDGETSESTPEITGIGFGFTNESGMLTARGRW